MDTAIYKAMPNGVSCNSNGSALKMVASSRCIENGLLSHTQADELLCKQTIARLQKELEKSQKVSLSLFYYDVCFINFLFHFVCFL